MTLAEKAVAAAERLPIPDAAIRAGIKEMLNRSRKDAPAPDPEADRAFALAMDDRPIAEHTDAANAQHYEVPADFFALCLGPRRKYSCCYYETPTSTLAQAEERALQLTCEHARLGDGQRILELGCGWGSLTLWMAERYPRATIRAVTNSRSQRDAIEARARTRDIHNVTVDVADMNVFDTQARYDRIVSVEMFEHMANWRALLERSRRWLKDNGLAFVHVFTHADTSYRFDHTDKTDWIAQHFFTGGLMPSRVLLDQFADIYGIDEVWEWDGRHYARTARDWLALFDANRDAIPPILARTYGDEAKLWLRRWRLFFLATEGLFGYEDGQIWGVTHYRLKPMPIDREVA